MRATAIRVAVVAVVAGGLAVASPLAAQACGCGGFVADQQVRVRQELAVVQLTATHEVVTMQFAADTDATSAAWVMPVPAHAAVELGDQALFDQLDQLTAPEVRTVDVEADGDGGGAGATPPGRGPGVTVTEHVTIGPYEVAQLTGPDPAAVTTWLTSKGFHPSATLTGGLAPYLRDGWPVVAVRLTGAGSHVLGGLLPPLRVSFDVSTPVYPMRLSAGASTPQALRLYVLAGHRMAATSPAPGDGELTVVFAGPNDQARYPAVPAVDGRPAYVTRYEGQWTSPGDITSDIRFSQDRTDANYRQVITRQRLVHTGDRHTAASTGTGSSSSWFAVAIGVLVLAAASTVTGVVLLVRRRSRRA